MWVRSSFDHRPAPDGAVLRPSRRQGGQVVPVLAVALLLAALLGVGLVRLAGADARRAAAQAAADASALAGADGGRPAAEAMAAANGAVLVSYRSTDLDVVVVVERQRVRAEARARWGVDQPVARTRPRWEIPTPEIAD